MALTVGELVAKITAKDGGFRKGLTSAKASLDKFRSDIDKSSRDVEALGKALTALAGIPALSIVAGSAITASGALLALPGAAGVAIGAFATLKTGTAGVGDALSALADGDAEKAAEALEKLSPAAKAATLAMNGVREQFRGVQQSVQQNLFAGLSAQITALGTTYLPLLKTGMSGVATSLNAMARQAMATASTPFFTGVVASTLASTQVSMANLTPAVSGLMLAVGALVKAGLPLIEQFTAWLGPALQAKGAFLASAEGAAWLQAKIDAAMPALQLLGVILGSTWTVLTTVAGALQSVAAWFQTLSPSTQALIGQFLAWGTVIGVVMMKLAPLVVAIGRLAPALIKAGIWIVKHVAQLAMMSARAVATAATYVAQWAMMAARSLASAARMAASWIIAMGPIGWVIAAIVGLVVLVIANWDKVKSFTISAWNAIVSFVVSVWNRIVSTITSAVSRAYSAVSSGFNRVVSFVASIPGRILSALGNLGSLLVSAGRSLIMGLWNGIKAAFDWVVGQVSGLMGTLRGLFPFSPAKHGPFAGSGYTSHSGKALMRDFAKGITSQESLVSGAMSRAMGAGAGRLDVRGRMAGAPGPDLARAVGQAVHDALDGARMEIDGRGLARIVNRRNLLDARRGITATI